MPRPPVTSGTIAWIDQRDIEHRIGGYQSWFPHRLDGPSRINWSNMEQTIMRLSWQWLKIGKSEVYRESGHTPTAGLYFYMHPDPEALRKEVMDA